MGRPGAGTGGSRPGGSRPSGGSSNRSRPVSGGRPGGGSPRSGGSRPSGSPPRGGFSGPPSPPPRRNTPPPRHTPPPPPSGRRRYYGSSGGNRKSRGGCIGTVIAGIIVVFIVLFVLAQTACGSCLSCLSCKNRDPAGNDRNSSNVQDSQGFQNNSSSTSSGITVSKNTPSEPFLEDCVIDELDWFDDVNKCGQDLKFFYDKLGLQPYVVFRQYDSSLSSDTDKQNFAVQWYNDNINNEDTLLVMYFAEEKSDEDIGYLCAVLGDNAAAVYDKLNDLVREGIDEYWSKPISTDNMITSAFRYASNKLTIK